MHKIFENKEKIALINQTKIKNFPSFMKPNKGKGLYPKSKGY